MHADIARRLIGVALLARSASVCRAASDAHRSPMRRCSGDRDGGRGAAQAGRRRQRGAGRRHDRAALGRDQRRRRAGADADLSPAPTCARRRGSAATRRCYLAAKGGHADVVAALLAAGADVEGRDGERHDAADARGALPATPTRSTSLIENGADINAQGQREGRDAADVRGRLQSRRRREAAARARRRSQGARPRSSICSR